MIFLRIFGITAAAAALFVGLLFFLLMPRRKGKEDRMRPLTAAPFAHRGYFDTEQGVPQNTLPAFQRAAEAGWGIELDVHLTGDGCLAVIHDSHLGALCRRDSRVEEMPLEELRKLRVQDTPYTIPSFREVLDTVNGAVPLLVEIKGDNVEPLVPLVMEELDRYSGLFCIESFNPLHLRWLRKNRPEVLRGQLACRYDRKERKGIREKLVSFALENLLCNFAGRPDFIAYRYTEVTRLPVRLLRRLGAPLAGWTIRDEEGLAYSKAHGVTVPIFEKIQP